LRIFGYFCGFILIFKGLLRFFVMVIAEAD
jgi:hypothetical protein